MLCSNCYATMTDHACPSCGRNLPVNARGTVDSVTGLMLAGWGRRAGGTFADGIVMFLPALLVYSIFAELDGYTIGSLCTFVAAGAYLVPSWTSKGGQSVGNRVAITRVRDAATGHRLAGLQAFKRWLFVALYLAIGLIPGVIPAIVFLVIVLADVLYPLYDPRNQTLHDKFANTLVVVA
jgi:uncharacterized RDD family membrane protein YckC